jgi:phage terminase large subunit
MVSTPNAPGGLFQQIEQEPFDKCLYKKMFLDYTYGLGKIYTQEEIEKAKQSPSFPREYELQYQGLIGNVFSQLSIENATKIRYDPTRINPNAKKSIGVDAGFGSSNFAIVVTQFVDGKIQVIFAEEYERPNFQAMINRIWEIKQKCGYISNIYVDAANPEVWESLKREFEERYDNQYIRDTVAECRKFNTHIEDRMIVVPVPFSAEGAHMLQHAKWVNGRDR